MESSPPVEQPPSARGNRALALLVPAVLLAAHFTLLLTSSLTKSVPADEQLHLLAGYSSLALHDFGYSQQHHHPALGTMLNAVPLLFVKGLNLPPTARQGGDPYPWRTQFLFQQPIPADTLLLWCRIPTMLLSVTLGLLVYLFTKQLCGTLTATIVLGLHLASPNILAHGQLITTDMIATLLIFATCWALWHYLQIRRAAWLIITSVLMGAALAAKLSCIILVPIIAVAFLWQAWRVRQEHPNQSIAAWLY